MVRALISGNVEASTSKPLDYDLGNDFTYTNILSKLNDIQASVKSGTDIDAVNMSLGSSQILDALCVSGLKLSDLSTDEGKQKAIDALAASGETELVSVINKITEMASEGIEFYVAAGNDGDDVYATKDTSAIYAIKDDATELYRLSDFSTNYSDNDVFAEMFSRNDADYSSSPKTSNVVCFFNCAGTASSDLNVMNLSQAKSALNEEVVATTGDAADAVLAVLKDSYGSSWNDSIETMLTAAAANAQQETLNFYAGQIVKANGANATISSSDPNYVAGKNIIVNQTPGADELYVDRTQMAKTFLAYFDAACADVDGNDSTKSSAYTAQIVSGTTTGTTTRVDHGGTANSCYVAGSDDKSYYDSYKDADTNADGIITSDEFYNYNSDDDNDGMITDADTYESVAGYDINNDGYVTGSELGVFNALTLAKGNNVHVIGATSSTGINSDVVGGVATYSDENGTVDAYYDGDVIVTNLGKQFSGEYAYDINADGKADIYSSEDDNVGQNSNYTYIGYDSATGLYEFEDSQGYLVYSKTMDGRTQLVDGTSFSAPRAAKKNDERLG